MNKYQFHPILHTPPSLPTYRRLRRLQTPHNRKTNHRRNRITNRQKLRNRHLHALRRTSNVRQRS
jgi:hypothetical protein